ncbi:unnamed protein product [Caenorhabditis bovis]|uniref:CHK kinase-like domain-containing protein n=1 Tax=Caenorhabditis bovis TaxID=2654633 RepID=A0A8S1E797_9PELO|nr:unnamed protein product [Caenorhabditis bovis]
MILISENPLSPISSILRNSEKIVLEDIGAGKGNLSTVNLVRFNSIERDLVVKMSLKEQSKILASPITLERFKIMHNTEVSVYKILENYPESNILRPKVYDMKEMTYLNGKVDAGHITMEMIECCQPISVMENLTVNQVTEVVIQVARFHALGYNLSKEEKSTIPIHLIDTWFVELFCEKNMSLFIKLLSNGFAELVGENLMKKSIAAFVQIFESENLEKLNNDCEFERVLCHGDVWPPNLLFAKEQESSCLKFKALCDFQTSNFGNPAQDLTRLFCSTLSGSDRRTNTRKLLELYYQELSNHCSPSFSVEMLEKEYAKFLPFAAAVICVPTPIRAIMQIRETVDENEKSTVY